MNTNLKKLRLENNFTQVDLQEKTGIDQTLLSKYETGKRFPPIRILIILADFYNVSIDYLLCRTEGSVSI